MILWRDASTARSIRANRLQTLAHPLFAQHQPLHGRVQVEGQHGRYGPPCGVGPEQPRIRPPESLFRTLWTSSPLAPLSRPPDQLICRNAPVGHHAENQPCWTAPSRGGSSICGRGCSINRSLVDEPILRAVLGVPIQLGTKPADPCPHDAPQSVQRLPVLLGDLGHRTAELRRHVQSPRTARLYPPRSTAATPAGTPPYPTSASPSPPPQADGRFNQHSQLLMARRRCRPETPNARSTRPLTSRCQRLVRTSWLGSASCLRLHQAVASAEVRARSPQVGVHLAQTLHSSIGSRYECSVSFPHRLLARVMEPLQIPEHRRLRRHVSDDARLAISSPTPCAR